MDVLNALFQFNPVMQGDPAQRLLLALLIAFVVGQLNAWCYKWTHRGVSYSRSFTQALILISVISALSMFMVVTNVVVAFGLLGGMAIIRFRTVVRDARDTAYVLMCLICGMAAGFGYYGAALMGSVVSNLVAVYLHKTNFGAWHAVDSSLQFQVDASVIDTAALETVLSRFCRRHSVISVDDVPAAGPDGQSVCHCSYRVRLRDPLEGPDLVAALKKAFNTDAVHLLIEQEHEEVA